MEANPVLRDVDQILIDRGLQALSGHVGAADQRGGGDHLLNGRPRVESGR